MRFKIEKLYFPGVQFHTLSQSFTKSVVARRRVLAKCGCQSVITSIPEVRRISNQPGDKDPGLAWKSSGKIFDKGPDQILPSSALYTWDKEGATRINYGTCDMGKMPAISIPSLLKNQVEAYPNNLAIASKINEEWKKWTYEKYYNDIITVAKAFLALGLERHHSVCILSFNRPEWFLSNFGSICAGGFSTGIYATNNSASVGYVAADSLADLVVVENDEQLAKVKEIQSQLPFLKKIILIEGKCHDKNVISWRKLMEIGKAESELTLKKRLSAIAVNQCCSLVYTSGTTGKPKGVMLSHDNLAYTTKCFCNLLEPEVRKETSDPLTMVSYLPLSHIAAQVADMYAGLSIRGGMAIYFGDKDSLKGTLIDTLRNVQPHIFLAVPRVYEKMYSRLCEVGEKNSGLKKCIANAAKARATKYNQRRINGETNPYVPGFKLCDKVIFSQLKGQVGFRNVKLFLSGGAPLSPDIIEYFLSVNIPIAQIYGLSETSGPSTVQHLSSFKVGSIGKPLPGTTAYIVNPNEEGVGELAMGGRCVMMGYIGTREKTLKCFNKEGHFLTGDLGTIDENGFISLSGRQKEIIITAGGENIAPVLIEDRVKLELAIVSNAVVIGEGQKCLSLLITLKTQLDPETNEPTEKLTEFVQDWISVNGDIEARTMVDVLGPTAIDSQHKLRRAIQRRIDKVNAKAISHAQLIRNWCILPADFSSSGGEFGPSLKLIRSVVNKKYASIIQALYNTQNAAAENQDNKRE